MVLDVEVTHENAEENFYQGLSAWRRIAVCSLVFLLHFAHFHNDVNLSIKFNIVLPTSQLANSLLTKFGSGAVTVTSLDGFLNRS